MCKKLDHPIRRGEKHTRLKMTNHWCALTVVGDGTPGSVFSIGAVTFTSPTEIVDEFFGRLADSELLMKSSLNQTLLRAIAQEPLTHRSRDAMIKDFTEWFLKQNRRSPPSEPTRWIVCSGHYMAGPTFVQMLRLGVITVDELPVMLFDVGTLLAALTGDQKANLLTYVAERKLPVLFKDLDKLHPIAIAVATGQAYFELNREITLLLAYKQKSRRDDPLEEESICPNCNAKGMHRCPINDVDDGPKILPLSDETDDASQLNNLETDAPPMTALEQDGIVKSERMSPPPARPPGDNLHKNSHVDLDDEDADIDDKKGEPRASARNLLLRAFTQMASQSASRPARNAEQKGIKEREINCLQSLNIFDT
jgi:hypothetical protein